MFAWILSFVRGDIPFYIPAFLPIGEFDYVEYGPLNHDQVHTAYYNWTLGTWEFLIDFKKDVYSDTLSAQKTRWARIDKRGE